jgi:predicted MFS family arabinose efflux permease
MHRAPEAGDAASAVYVVALQVGIGGGALVGERFVSAGRPAALPLVGAVLVGFSGVLVLLNRVAFPRYAEV